MHAAAITNWISQPQSIWLMLSKPNSQSPLTRPSYSATLFLPRSFMPVFLSLPFPRSICPPPPFIPASTAPRAFFQGPVVPRFSSIRSRCVPTVSFKQCCFLISFSSPHSSLRLYPSSSDGSNALLVSFSYCILRSRFLDSAGQMVVEMTSSICLCAVKFSSRPSPNTTQYSAPGLSRMV